MTLSIGVDIVEIERLRQSVIAEPNIVHDLFTDSELVSSRSTHFAHAYLAACLAVKEAFLKATGFGLHEGLRFKDIEVITDAAGASGLRLHGKLRSLVGDAVAAECQVSSAFTKHLACAVVTMPQKGRETDESIRQL